MKKKTLDLFLVWTHSLLCAYNNSLGADTVSALYHDTKEALTPRTPLYESKKAKVLHVR